MADFPKVKYHRVQPPVTVASAKEEKALDPKCWADSPAFFGVVTCPAEGQPTYDATQDVMKEDGLYMALASQEV